MPIFEFTSETMPTPEAFTWMLREASEHLTMSCARSNSSSILRKNPVIDDVRHGRCH